ncbi:MAG: EF-hand domain-containing protein [Alphaproteobacteria bacterium]
MKTGLKVLLAATMLATVTMAGFAVAKDKGGHQRGMRQGVSMEGSMGGHMMDRMDANGDETITLDEFLVGHQDRFSSADADDDGFLTEEEIHARASDPVGRGVERMIERLDTDGDGKVSRAEAIAVASERAGERAGERFDSTDADSDGFITAEEAREHMGNRGERRMGRYQRGFGSDDHESGEGRHHGRRAGGHDDGDRDGHGRWGRDGRDHARAGQQGDGDHMGRMEGRGERMQGQMQGQMQGRMADRITGRMMSLLDTDGDDRISRQEAEARGATQFAQLDKNDDGKLVADELQAGRGAMFRKHRN